MSIQYASLANRFCKDSAKYINSSLHYSESKINSLQVNLHEYMPRTNDVSRFFSKIKQ